MCNPRSYDSRILAVPQHVIAVREGSRRIAETPITGHICSKIGMPLCNSVNYCITVSFEGGGGIVARRGKGGRHE